MMKLQKIEDYKEEIDIKIWKLISSETSFNIDD